MQITRRAVLSGGVALLVAGSATAGGVIQIGGRAFGSYWRCVLPVGRDAAAVSAMIESFVEEIDAELSPWRSSSQLCRLNQAPGNVLLEIGPHLHRCLQEAETVRQVTEGGFDARVGPLVARYGFGRIAAESHGTDGQFQLSEMSVRKGRAEVTFDPCGLGKGYALDRIAEALARRGISDALVDLGGELRGLGRHPAGRPWRAVIEQPTGAPAASQRIVGLTGRALATSGHAASGVGGRGSTSHIVNPQSGRPADQRLWSVSVLAVDAIRADALATGLLALGPQLGPQLADDKGIAALFQIADGGRPAEIFTGGFRAHLLI